MLTAAFWMEHNQNTMLRLIINVLLSDQILWPFLISHQSLKKMAVLERLFWQLGTGFSGQCHCREVHVAIVERCMWPKSIFSQQHQYIIKGKCCENQWNNHLMGKALICYQILSTNSCRNVWRSVWRVCIWILGLKGLIQRKLMFYECLEINRKTVHFCILN